MDNSRNRKSCGFAFVLLIFLCGAITNTFVSNVACSNLTVANANELVRQQLERYNFLVGIAKVGLLSAPETKCGQELDMLLSAIAQRQHWSIKVLDSFGAPPKTFTWGNYYWFSMPSLCDGLNEPLSISFSSQHAPHIDFNVTSPMRLRFTMIYMDFETPYFIDLKLPFETYIHLGLCLPSNCNEFELMHYADLYFQSEIFEMQKNFDLKLKSVTAKSPKFEWRLLTQTGSVLLTFLTILIIALIILAELVHKSQERLKAQQQLHTKSINTTTKSNNILQKPSSTLEMLLLSFRLSSNYKRAIRFEGDNSTNMNGKSQVNFLSAIAGLRTIVCLWVTVFHVYYYSLYAMSNAPIIFAKLEQFAFQPILQACFYVDVFFVISAFLLVYNFLANAQQMQQIAQNTFGENLKLWLKTLAHRYLRLTPVMIVTMLMSDIVHDVLNMTSPFRLGAHSGIYCKKTWWYNLLYIHNFLDMENICCSWTWYLACEMQYFVLFTTLLYVYAKRPNAAKMIFTTLSLGFVATAWFCNYSNGISFQIDVIYSTLNQLYVKPWVRIIPYIGGAIAGWLLYIYEQQQQQQNHHHQQQQHSESNEQQQQQHQHQEQQQQQEQCQLSLCQHRQQCHHSQRCHWRSLRCSSLLPIDAVWWRAAFWLFIACIYVATNFMSYWRTTPATLVAIIMSLGKLLFALCVGGAIALCASGCGGYLCVFLSAPIFRQLNKFCFSIYMLAPIFVFASFGLRNEATNFTEVASANDFCAVIIMSLASAFLLMLFVELPMQQISNFLLKKRHSHRPAKKDCEALA